MTVNPARLVAQPYASSLDTGDARSRQKRSYAANPPVEQWLIETVKRNPSLPEYAEYELVSENPDPGKKVEPHQKTPVPVETGLNLDVDSYVENIDKDFKTVSEDAAQTIKQLFKKKWALDIDPDRTYLATFDYNTTGSPPYPARLIKQITLTEALVKNAQDTPNGRGVLVPHYAGGPSVRLVEHLPRVAPGVLDFADRVSPGRESAHITHTYQGLYSAPAPGVAQAYGPSTQLPVSPQAFKDEVWNTDFQRPHTEFLNTFWDSHDRKYPIVAKAALVKAADAQHQEGTLTPQDKELVMRAVGLPNNEQAWADTLITDLMRPTAPDPGLEVGLLKLGRYESTDLMVITDKTRRQDAEGKSINRTLLYIPGNSSPIHAFDGVDQMKHWLAKQAADPVKRKALEGHFTFNELRGSVWHAGVTETLQGLGSWPRPGERYRWDPAQTLGVQRFNATGRTDTESDIDTTCDVFHQIGERQRLRSYADARAQITSDSDVTKQHLLSTINKAAMVAMLFAPLAMAVPGVALAMDGLYIASGLIEVGIGADDVAKGRPGGAEHVIFGVLNAALPVATRVYSQVHHAVEGGAAGGELSSRERLTPSEPTVGEPVNPSLEYHIQPLASERETLQAVSETLSEDGQLITLTGTKENLNRVEENLYTFVDMNKKGIEHRLNIIAHGDGTHIYYNGRKHTPQGLFDTLRRNGIFAAHYDNIRILSCYSGKLGEDSFAAEFQRLCGRPVKGYLGEVTARYSAEHIVGDPEVAYHSGENPIDSGGNELDDGVENKQFSPEKHNPYSLFKNPFKWWNFSYKPVVFNPAELSR